MTGTRAALSPDAGLQTSRDPVILLQHGGGGGVPEPEQTHTHTHKHARREASTLKEGHALTQTYTRAQTHPRESCSQACSLNGAIHPCQHAYKNTYAFSRKHYTHHRQPTEDQYTDTAVRSHSKEETRPHGEWVTW